jgi:RNA polymerase sigma-70 factor (ECF subfamily)
MSDNELINYYKLHKDSDCVGELYKRYTGFTLTICLKYLKNIEEAREATLEIFEELIDKLLVHDVNNFKPWLYSVAKNYCLLIFRSKKNDKIFNEDIETHQKNFVEQDTFLHQDHASDENYYTKLETGITKLKEEQRTCIELFYLQNKSYVEVSKITGYTMNEVKTYIQNGKRNLKIFMNNKNE